MIHVYTDKQLNELNRYPNVYSVNKDFADRKNYKFITPNPKNANEINIIKTDGQKFRVIATKSDPETGFDGMAVAPIVNGKPDYKSDAVVAAGTDPKNKEYLYLSVN